MEDCLKKQINILIRAAAMSQKSKSSSRSLKPQPRVWQTRSPLQTLQPSGLLRHGCLNPTCLMLSLEPWGSLNTKEDHASSSTQTLKVNQVSVELCWRLCFCVWFMSNRNPCWSSCSHGTPGGGLRLEEEHRKHPGDLRLHRGAGIVSDSMNRVLFTSCSEEYVRLTLWFDQRPTLVHSQPARSSHC